MWQAIQQNPIVLSIPIVAGLIGWFTNWIAIVMMFKPIEFIGIKPFLGWQGVIPANSMRLAVEANRLLNQHLLSLEEIFKDFDAAEFTQKLDRVVDDITNQILEEVATKHAKVLWENAGEFMRNKVRDMVRAEVYEVTKKIAHDAGANIVHILDIEQTVVEAVGKNKGLMGEMFRKLGGREFKFIELSGWWIGLLFGIPQMLLWIVYPAPWTLAASGLVVGYVTNWVAMKLVFHPRQPVRVGPFSIQGLFHKRQNDVAEAFGDITATRFLNADNLVAAVVNDPQRLEYLHGLVTKHIDELIAKYEKHPMAAMVVPPQKRAEIRNEVLVRLKEELPKPGGFFHTFAGNAVDIQGELTRRMKALDSETYEGVLRPPFRHDEWKLIVAGAVLGMIAGILQWAYTLKDTIENLKAG